MNKNILYLTILLCAAMFTSCLMEQVDDARYYNVRVNLIGSSDVDLSAVTWSKVTVVNNDDGSETEYFPESGTGELTIELKSGSYGFRLIALSDELTFNGLASQGIYNDATIEIPVQKGAENGLVFKEVYSAGIYLAPDVSYWHDGFVELYNNSDETIYLDGIVVGIVDGMYGGPSAWIVNGQLPDYYPLTNMTFYFPGSGTEYPLSAREGIVVATKAIDHNAAPHGVAGEVVNRTVDLRGADWEFYDGSTGTSDIDNPNVPNLLLMNKLYGLDFMPAPAGQSLILARIPGTYGDDLVSFAADAANKKQKPGQTWNNCLIIPGEYVFEGVDITQAPLSSRTNKLIQNKDDVGYTYYDDIDGTGLSGMYSGKSIRRKVVGFTPDDKPIYLDSNNSNEDFNTGGQLPPTPGVHPTEVD